MVASDPDTLTSKPTLAPTPISHRGGEGEGGEGGGETGVDGSKLGSGTSSGGDGGGAGAASVPFIGVAQLLTHSKQYALPLLLAVAAYLAWRSRQEHGGAPCQERRRRTGHGGAPWYGGLSGGGASWFDGLALTPVVDNKKVDRDAPDVSEYDECGAGAKGSASYDLSVDPTAARPLASPAKSMGGGDLSL